MEIDTDQFPRKESRCSGRMQGYLVEARYTGLQPALILKQIFDDKWRQVSFPESSNGVPQGARHEWALAATYTYSYQAAEALRWWLHAEAHKTAFSDISLESRIVKVDIEYELKYTEVSAHKHIHFEDRSNHMPDWSIQP